MIADRSHHEHFMRLALEDAQAAWNLGEVPVGAILVDNGDIVSRACNRTIINHDSTAHAEILALRQAGQVLQNYRLTGLTMYVTLEPCCMCAMAAIHARIKTIVYAASDPRTGACGSVFNIALDSKHNHQLEVIGGVLEDESAAMLKAFFKERRAEQKEVQQLKQLAKAQGMDISNLSHVPLPKLRAILNAHLAATAQHSYRA